MRGYKRTFFGANTIHWIILGIVVFLVGGFFYFDMRRGDEVVFDLKNNRMPVHLPEGIEIDVNKNGVQEINNIIDGYKVEADKIDSVNYDTGLLSIMQQHAGQQTDEGGYIPQYTINTIDFEGSLEEYLAYWLKDKEFSDEYGVSRKEIQGKDVFIIVPPSFGNAEQILITKENKRVIIVSSYFINIEEILKNITFN